MMTFLDIKENNDDAGCLFHSIFFYSVYLFVALYHIHAAVDAIFTTHDIVNDE